MGVMDSRQRIIAAQPHRATSTGSSVLIAEPKIESLQVTFAPVQSGSGTPSPSNVRPISGWSTIPVSIGSLDYSALLGSTYYGGTVDLVTGVLTVTHTLVVYDGSSDEAWNVENGSAGVNFYISVPDANYEDGVGGTQLCNVAASRKTAGWAAGSFFISAGKNLNLAIGNLIGITTVSDFKIWLASNNVQLYYKLATAQTYGLTPQTITALRGTNPVSSEAGSTSITYWTH